MLSSALSMRLSMLSAVSVNCSHGQTVIPISPSFTAIRWTAAVSSTPVSFVGLMLSGTGTPALFSPS
jgi:hypothetical protein